ncbi:MAG: hypothetical protein HQ522_11680 [Bacteroidetes bacterium]|nr:hypothetical protein [Bacteroidota bacterium]
MKYFCFLLLFTFFLISCEEEEETPDIEIPEWLEPRIEELENWEACATCSVKRYTFKGEYYYTVSCGIWSCSFPCELYNEQGHRIQNEDQFDINNFRNNKINETEIWRCQDSE